VIFSLSVALDLMSVTLPAILFPSCHHLHGW
jgi:hypothetical protein